MHWTFNSPALSWNGYAHVRLVCSCWYTSPLGIISPTPPKPYSNSINLIKICVGDVHVETPRNLSNWMENLKILTTHFIKQIYYSKCFILIFSIKI